MNNQLREIILQIVLEEYESGHQVASDKESFDRVIEEDFDLQVGPEAFEFYAECRNMGPSGFYLMYGDELDFSEDFKREYGFDHSEEAIIEESLTEDIDPSFDDKYEVQQIDKEGERLDQFISFNTKEEAMNFIKKLNTPAQVVQKGVMQESLDPNGEVIYTNLDSLEEGLSRDIMISGLRGKGKNYNFNKYSDAQIYRMYQREMNKEESPKLILPEEDDYHYCEFCKHQLTDGGQCPVCDLGDEEERTSHVLYDTTWQEPEELDEAVLNEAPNLDKKQAKIAKTQDKEANKNAKAILGAITKTLDPKNSYYIIGDGLVDYQKYNSYLNAVKNDLNNIDKLLSVDPASDDFKKLKAVIDTTVVNKDRWIIRRGLELIRPGRVAYRPDRLDLVDIPQEYSSKSFLGKHFVPAEATPAQEKETNTPEVANETSEENPANEISNEPETSSPNWVTDKAIKTAINLLAKRKNGSMNYFDKSGKLFDYRKITADNIGEVFADRYGKKPFLDVLKEVKDGLAKRKAAAIKSAAIFGESYDDSLEYDITDITTNELDDLI